MAQSYARSILPTNPETAAAWAQTIRDESIREQALVPESKVRWLQLAASMSGAGEVSGLRSIYSVLSQPITEAADTLAIAIDETITPKPVEQFVDERLQVKIPHGTGAQWQDCASCHK